MPLVVTLLSAAKTTGVCVRTAMAIVMPGIYQPPRARIKAFRNEGEEMGHRTTGSTYARIIPERIVERRNQTHARRLDPAEIVTLVRV